MHVADEQVFATQSKITSVLREVADRLDVQGSRDVTAEDQSARKKDVLDTKAYAFITRFRAINTAPDDALITPEMTSLVNSK